MMGAEGDSTSVGCARGAAAGGADPGEAASSARLTCPPPDMRSDARMLQSSSLPRRKQTTKELIKLHNSSTQAPTRLVTYVPSHAKAH